MIDRPDLNTAFATRSWWALGRGARRSMEFYIKQLTDPEYTDLLIGKAKSGVRVDLNFTEQTFEYLSPTCEQMLARALIENPNLPITIKRFARNQKYLHLNIMIVDEEVGFFGTLYPWAAGFSKLDLAGGGTEYGAILQGADLLLMRQQLRSAMKQMDAPWLYSLKTQKDDSTYAENSFRSFVIDLLNPEDTEIT